MTSLLKAASIAALIAFGATTAQAATALRLAHPTPESDLQHIMAVHFKEAVEKASDGEITVTIFPNGQLGTDAQMIDGVRSGIIDMEISGLNNFTGLLPEASAFELPFMFESRDAAFAALDGEAGQTVAKNMEQFNLKNLGYPENGFRNITNNRGPIKEPKDLEGLRMRVNNSAALSDMFELLGANPQQLPVAELYTALETGVVDAQDHPIGIVLSFKFYEVQKYLSMTRHAYAALNWVMNLNKFNGLSPEDQKIITDAARESVTMQRQMSIDSEDKMLSELESDGMEINRDVDTAAFKEAVKPVWDTFTSQNGDTLVKAIQASGS